MTEAHSAEGWLKLASILTKTAMAGRSTLALPARLRGALFKALAFSCFGGAIVLALVAIGLGVGPFLGAAGAVAIDAGLLAALGLAAFPWRRGRGGSRATPPPGLRPEVLLAGISESLAREKGLSIVAGLLVGILAASARSLTQTGPRGKLRGPASPTETVKFLPNQNPEGFFMSRTRNAPCAKIREPGVGLPKPRVDAAKARPSAFLPMRSEFRVSDLTRPSAEEAMHQLRILLVEADATIGLLLAEILEDLGAVICAVEANIAKVASAAARWHPNLIIVDVGLGDADGVAAIAEILAAGLIPCVFVTDDNLRIPSDWPGAVLIRKPFRGPEIVAAIRRAMSEFQRRADDASSGQRGSS